MELQEQLQSASRLLIHLTTYNQTGVMKMHPDDKQDLSRLYNSIYHITPNVTCGTCIIQYLTMLEAWYERERPKEEPKKKGKK